MHAQKVKREQRTALHAVHERQACRTPWQGKTLVPEHSLHVSLQSTSLDDVHETHMRIFSRCHDRTAALDPSLNNPDKCITLHYDLSQPQNKQDKQEFMHASAIELLLVAQSRAAEP
jgi:hypothetical protein